MNKWCGLVEHFAENQAESRLLNDATNSKGELHFVLRQSIDWIIDKTGSARAKNIQQSSSLKTTTMLAVAGAVSVTITTALSPPPAAPPIFSKPYLFRNSLGNVSSCWRNTVRKMLRYRQVVTIAFPAFSRRQLWACALETCKRRLPCQPV